MKKMMVLLGMAALLLVGCSSKPKPTVLHVTTADTCERTVVGTIGNMEYQLKPESAPLWAACWGPVGMTEVGSDFPATVDLVRGVVTLKVHVWVEDRHVKPDAYGFQLRETDHLEYMIVRRREVKS